MKKINKKYFIVSVLAVFLYAAKSASPYPDFSGTWVLDREHSSIPNPSLVYDRLIVNQQPDTITIENVLTAKNGIDSSSAEKFSFMGSISKKILPDISHGIDTRYRSITRSRDGQSIIMTERNELDVEGVVQRTNVTDVWTLLRTDELMIASTFKFPDRTLTAKAVYHKK